MYPPIFEVCKASPAVVALLGSNPLRFYPFGEAPQNVAKPYVVWQQVGGAPEKYLAGRPDIDGFSLQVDAYGTSAAEVRAVVRAIRDAIELRSNIVAWGVESRDPETHNYRSSFDVDWFVHR
jgi:hypothetical protein